MEKILEKAILLLLALVVLANTALISYVILEVLKFAYKTWPAGQTLF